MFKKKINIDLPSAFDVKESEVYLHRRAIFGGNFYYAQKFKQFVNTLVPNKFTDLDYDDSRIIIPLVKDSELIGLQGRSLGPSNVKYITVMLSDDAPKIYGYDEIDHEKPIYIVEGPFDSTFLDNSIGWLGLILISGRIIGAIIFGFMITNLVTEKSSTESPKQLIEERR